LGGGCSASVEKNLTGRPTLLSTIAQTLELHLDLNAALTIQLIFNNTPAISKP